MTYLKLADGKSYAFAPLTFGQLKRVKPKLVALQQRMKAAGGSLPSDEDMADMMETIHLSLKRHHPEITTEAMEDLIDMENVGHVTMAIMGQSGLIPTEAKGEAPASGEA